MYNLLRLFSPPSLYHKNTEKYRKSIIVVHSKKIESLGGKLHLQSCPPDDVIFNYSARIISTREKFLLSSRLNFRLPVYKPPFYKYFLSFETLIHKLKKLQLAPGHFFNTVIIQVKGIAYKSFYGFKSNKYFQQSLIGQTSSF